MSAKPPTILTFGCRLNAYESEVMREHARAIDSGVETIIINTCAVTAEAERQARQAIRKARRENPEARIVVTGCAAQAHPELYGEMAEIDQILGNAEKLKPEIFAEPPSERIVVGDIMKLREVASHLVSGFEGRARAFVEVQQGCDHRCTFCIIPFGRGPNRSVPVERVIAQARELVAAGTPELVLTGVDVTAYGADLPGRPPLGTLVRQLLAAVPDLPRLRLSSLDPVEVDDDLIEAFAHEPRLLPHAHLSVQAGDDTVLKRMARRHRRADIIALAARLRAVRPDIVLGADLIAGFPGEDEAMAAGSLSLIDEIGLTHLHVFPFSPRPGTPAATMKRVAGPVVKARAAALRQKGEAAMDALLRSRVGAEATIVIERDGKGHCEYYLPVRVGGTTAAPGAVLRTRIIGVEGGVLDAEEV
ncbi:tRNA (N(6)-L-threonylcarbamoyladenosine(37)-C(2))-methylthiotransferase MtaB [Magnetospirillum fulvum]|uniref:2-methylthioadenine synthetase n=1 Tax=Magnetospirillum fulvum MGU-K5 TaxID=1316936 RepID=S9TSY7_MAGFU|nr:tRNA (N(6)-L-threonylcarbamoyladenosine(37)-C(2))-methylthiotransferase MtaB [Magnetospirillum fulvum]EPY01635.1 2-methylthioadenine synthetase [Magnetospirillum fulvum MGU-K5]